MRIREQEELPVFEGLGDISATAITHDQIAALLKARGQLDEAVHIRQQLVLPAFQRLGDIRALAVAHTNLAIDLLHRAAPGDRERAEALLTLALADARRLGIHEAGQIEEIIRQHNLQPEA